MAIKAFSTYTVILRAGSSILGLTDQLTCYFDANSIKDKTVNY